MKRLLPLLILLSACSNEKVEIKRVQEGAVIVKNQQPLREFSGALDEVRASACVQLNRLAKSETFGSAYSYLHWVGAKNGKWYGALDISESPFVQLILGEKFEAGSEDEFFKKAQEERAAGKIGGMKWFFVRMMRGIGLLSWVQYPVINGKLEENFPGIFGEPQSLENSIPFKWASRATDLDPLTAPAILTKKLPLFAKNWEELSEETKVSLGAAMNGLKQSGNERLCSFVLLQRHFAQLLRLKGYDSVEFFPGAEDGGLQLSQVEELSTSLHEFLTKPIPGAFFDLGEKNSIVLANEGIPGYDPSQKLLGVTKDLPDGTISYEAGSLSEALWLMEILSYGFEATSPASKNAQVNGYVYGDVLAEGSKALVPAEAHALSLGLLTMHFKNLALLHIKKVNAKGVLLKEGERAAGIMLSDNGKIRLRDVTRLVKVVSHLDTALDRFVNNSPEHWEAMNGVYNRKSLAALFGKALIPEAEGVSLKENLQALKLPLAMLMSQLAELKASEVEWNSSTGVLRPVKSYNYLDKVELKAAFSLLARDTDSPLLQKKADSL